MLIGFHFGVFVTLHAIMSVIRRSDGAGVVSISLPCVPTNLIICLLL